MRVLYVITQQDMGGAQNYVLTLGRAFKGLVASGQEGTFLSGACAAQGVPFHPITHLQRKLNPLSDLRALWEIYKLLRLERPNLVHTNSSKAGILASIAGFLSGTPVVFTAHGFQYLEPMSVLARSFFWFCELLCRPLRAFVITVSETDRKRAIAHKVISPYRSKTIYHGIDIPNFLPRDVARISLGIPPQVFCIGTIANHYRTKGVDILLHSFAALQAQAALALIGDGPERPQLEKLAQTLGIQNRVRFIGQKQNANTLLKAFDVFVLPSRKEGFPYALLEALAAGLPSIAANVGGNSEALNGAGLLVPAENSTAFTHALQKLCDDSMLRDTLSALAIARSKAFTIGKMVTSTTEIYESVLRAKKS